MPPPDGEKLKTPPDWWSPDPVAVQRHIADLSDQAGVLSQGSGAKPVESVGLCGAGVMGASIAAATVVAGIQVRMYDVSPASLNHGIQAAWDEIGLSDEHAPTDRAARSADARISACSELDELTACDLIIESVVEEPEIKREVLQRIASVADRAAVIATNTSTIRIADLSTPLTRPEQFCGLHFFVPVRSRPLVEVVRGEKTDDPTIATAVAFATRLGKRPIVVRDCPGFLINRLLLPYLGEAQEMLCQGVELEAIDRAATRFGMALGPFELIDAIGTDTAMSSGRSMYEAFPERVPLTPVLRALVKRKRLGRKAGAGFYRYPMPEGPPEQDPNVDKILDPYIRPTVSYTQTDIVMRLFLAMLLEATRVLDEKVANSVQDIDFGIIHGLGFPESRGGLLYWADAIGAERIIELLRPFKQLGARMQPTERLVTLASTKGKFYGSI